MTLLLGSLALAACGGPDGSAGEEEAAAPVGAGGAEVEATAVAFDTVPGRVVTEGRTLPVTLELADTEEQRSFGLMERETLGTDHGMLFRYEADQPGDAGFWMYRTWIPLDIAFLDGDGTIVAVLQMDPCRSTSPGACQAETYAPGVPYRSAVEMRRGWFAANSVGVGDRVEVVTEGSGAEG